MSKAFHGQLCLWSRRFPSKPSRRFRSFLSSNVFVLQLRFAIKMPHLNLIWPCLYQMVRTTPLIHTQSISPYFLRRRGRGPPLERLQDVNMCVPTRRQQREILCPCRTSLHLWCLFPELIWNATAWIVVLQPLGFKIRKACIGFKLLL